MVKEFKTDLISSFTQQVWNTHTRDFIDVPRLGFDKWVHYYKTESTTPGQFSLMGYVGKKRLSIQELGLEF